MFLRVRLSTFVTVKADPASHSCGQCSFLFMHGVLLYRPCCT
ncbi:hypothetical protein SEA_TRAX_63 [Gordonia phage Trax]|uniref:Uncharacterized protein n=1 Tax=Gordonia phage Trax TaxID=2591121 RepID=A0A515MH17_9CAUD|nr:hypothetical protein L3Y20_gp063 [Gordonia phage Trax]QDM55950.1 hypothetical protein SEA_TRAX_63 [Gordonia phage Trax]